MGPQQLPLRAAQMAGPPGAVPELAEGDAVVELVEGEASPSSKRPAADPPSEVPALGERNSSTRSESSIATGHGSLRRAGPGIESGGFLRQRLPRHAVIMRINGLPAPSAPSAVAEVGRALAAPLGLLHPAHPAHSERLPKTELNPEHLEDHFQVIKRQLEMRMLNIRMPFMFKYKNRLATGHAIHVAALHSHGHLILGPLLKLKADVDDECSFPSWGGKLATAMPIHLAACKGGVKVLQALITARADLHAKATYDGEPHYEPIHDAAFGNNVEAVRCLIENGASVNSVNKDGLSPLHLAAKVGSAPLAELLVAARSDTQLHNRSQQTPLMMALDGDAFPQERLQLLVGHDMASVLMVAHRYPRVAAVMLQEMRGTLEGVTTKDFVELLTFAPQAAAGLLDAVMVTPEVQDAGHHPLPKRARLKPDEVMCHYGEAVAWEHSVSNSGRAYPRWHEDLVPGLQLRERSAGRAAFQRKNAEELVDVHVKLVQLPNVICTQVLYALATTTHEHVFSMLLTSAMLSFAWSYVQTQYTTLLAYRSMKLVMLVAWAFSPESMDVISHMTWSVLMAVAAYELVANVYEAIGYWLVLRQPLAYLKASCNWFDLIGVTLTLALAISTSDTLSMNSQPEIMALISLYQWWHVLYTLRGYQAFGRRIIPILRSFSTMGPMLIITLTLFLGFFHAQITLQQNQIDSSGIPAALFQIFAMFLASDSGGMLWTLQGPDSAYGNFLTWLLLIMSVFLFNVCVMNLFIAVQSEAYDRAQDHMKPLFLQERAQICLRSFMHMHLRPGRRVRYACVVAVLLLLAGWAGLLQIRGLHPVVPTLLLLAAMLLGDALQLQRHWEWQESVGQDNAIVCLKEQRHYLWVCYRADWLQDPELPSIEEETSRYSSIKSLIELNGNRSILEPCLQQLEHVVLAQDEASERLGQLESRLEGCLEEVHRRMAQRFDSLAERLDDLQQAVLRTRG